MEVPEPAVKVQIENKVEPQEPAVEVAQPVLEVQVNEQEVLRNTSSSFFGILQAPLNLKL